MSQTSKLVDMVPFGLQKKSHSVKGFVAHLSYASLVPLNNMNLRRRLFKKRQAFVRQGHENNQQNCKKASAALVAAGAFRLYFPLKGDSMR
jgi:hypothetical protein